eukprot:SAG22_NODE_7496_length_734_cov_1.622047_1_plen_35_part_10
MFANRLGPCRELQAAQGGTRGYGLVDLALLFTPHD